MQETKPPSSPVTIHSPLPELSTTSVEPMPHAIPPRPRGDLGPWTIDDGLSKHDHGVSISVRHRRLGPMGGSKPSTPVHGSSAASIAHR